MKVLLVTVAAIVSLAAGWKPPYKMVPVAMERIDGTTLCITNLDGTSLLVDAPGLDWRTKG